MNRYQVRKVKRGRGSIFNVRFNGQRMRGFDRCSDTACRVKVRFGVLVAIHAAAADGEGNYEASDAKGILIYCRNCARARNLIAGKAK